MCHMADPSIGLCVIWPISLTFNLQTMAIYLQLSPDNLFTRTCLFIANLLVVDTLVYSSVHSVTKKSVNSVSLHHFTIMLETGKNSRVRVTSSVERLCYSNELILERLGFPVLI